MKNSEGKSVGNSDFWILTTDYLGFYTPWRVFAILTSVKQADAITVRVGQISLAPEPVAVGWVFVKYESERFEAGYLGIEVVAFEIQNDVVGSDDVLG